MCFTRFPRRCVCTSEPGKYFPGTNLGQRFHFTNEALTPRGEEAGPKLHSWFQSWLHHLPETLCKSFKNALTLTFLFYNIGYHPQLQGLSHALDKTASKLGFINIDSHYSPSSLLSLLPLNASQLLYRQYYIIGICPGSGGSMQILFCHLTLNCVPNCSLVPGFGLVVHK